MNLDGLCPGTRSFHSSHPGGLTFFHTARLAHLHQARQVGMRLVVKQASACLDSVDRLWYFTIGSPTLLMTAPPDEI
jgi:hypothetical protein